MQNISSNEQEQQNVGNKKILQKEFIKFICLYIFLPALLTYFLFGYVFTIAMVSGISMYPTLKERQIVVSFNLFYTPQRGDIIICQPQTYDKRLIKRVIAVENDTVFIDKESGDVYINGKKLDEPYIKKEALNTVPDSPITILPNHVFVMGDNRNNSLDSRSEVIGQVPINDIIGKVII